VINDQTIDRRLISTSTFSSSAKGSMRVSVPTIPHIVNPQRPRITSAEAIKQITSFLEPTRNVTVLTGAGVSVDSGIRAYRGKDGRYMNPNYH
jgi:NAD-dependent deacetylase sirtuin 4